VKTILPRTLDWIAGFLLLGLCLFGGPLSRLNNHVGSFLREIAAVFEDPSTQWMVVLCALAYFACFAFLRLRSPVAARRLWATPAFWLSAFTAIASISFFVSAVRGRSATAALMLVTGAALGQGVALWNASTRRRTGLTILTIPGILVLLLMLATLFNSDSLFQFHYRGMLRSTGAWDNPNTFGNLMAVGLVLAAGQCFRLGMSVVRSSRQASGLTGISRQRGAMLIPWVQAAFFAAASVLFARGLLGSYSRGAWLGAALAFSYLAWNWFTGPSSATQTPSPSNTNVAGVPPALSPLGPPLRPPSRPRLRAFLLPAAVILGCIFVFAFWTFRHADTRTARRVFSVANPNDFSWKNRLAAYEGALQMIAARPWLGYGWNQPEPLYGAFYKPPQVTEGMAIQLNDYFTLGMAIGLPALACFLVSIGLAFGASRETSRHAAQHSAASPHHSQRIICRAAVIVLLVGFWFDGGLFKLPTAAPFWILLDS